LNYKTITIELFVAIAGGNLLFILKFNNIDVAMTIKDLIVLE